MGNNKISCVIFLAILLLIAPHTSQAINCGEIVNWLLPCLNFLKNGVPPTEICCKGAHSANNAAGTVADKRVACACIKQAAKSYAINYDYANQLNPKCGIKREYILTPEFDCSKINH